MGSGKPPKAILWIDLRPPLGRVPQIHYADFARRLTLHVPLLEVMAATRPLLAAPGSYAFAGSLSLKAIF